METRRITIVREDNVVVVNGKAHTVDLSSMHPYLSAVQWYGETQTGEMEFIQTPGQPFALNIPITSIDGWKAAIEAWDAAELAEQTPVKDEQEE